MNKLNQANVDYANELLDSSYKMKEFYPTISKTFRTAADIIKIQAVRIEQFERMVEDAKLFEGGDLWSWQGDGEDHIASMSNGMKVIINAAELRDIVQSKYITSEINNVNMGDGDDDYERAMKGIL